MLLMISCIGVVCSSLKFQLRIPADIAVRVENYAAVKILLDARGGPVSISFEYGLPTAYGSTVL